MAIIIANWKMNMGLAGSGELAASLRDKIISQPVNCEIVICPSFPYINIVTNAVKDSVIAVGGQDCSAYNHGAFTGDVSAGMLADSGCKYVILGHSERRALHNESSSVIKQKASNAHKYGLITIICVGETMEQKERGVAFKTIKEQVQQSLPSSLSSSNTIIAYEPVWAIGTGNNPSQDDISRAHGFIHDVVKDFAKTNGILFEKDVKIVYGGSVKSSNCKNILSLPMVDGLLVGGASLVCEEFYNILVQG